MVNAFVFMQKVFLLDFEWAMKLYIFSGAYNYYKEHFHLFQQNPTKSFKIFPLWDTFPWSVKRQDMKMLNSHLPIEIQMRGGPTKAM